MSQHKTILADIVRLNSNSNVTLRSDIPAAEEEVKSTARIRRTKVMIANENKHFRLHPQGSYTRPDNEVDWT